MDTSENLSPRVLLRNILITEPPRTPVTRSHAKKPSTSGLRRSTRLTKKDADAQSPQNLLRRSLKQKLHESIIRRSFPAPKRRTASLVNRRLAPSAASSMLFGDGETPRHLLRNILQTEPVKSPVIHKKRSSEDEPEPPPADDTVTRNLPSFELSGLDLPDVTIGNVASTAKVLSRKRPRRSLNITAFEKRLKDGGDAEEETENSTGEHSSLSLSSSTSLSLKTPFVDIRTEKKGLQRKVSNRRKITEEEFGEAVKRWEMEGVSSFTQTQDLGKTTFCEGVTLGLSKLSEPDITADIVNACTALDNQPDAVIPNFSIVATEDKSTVMVSQIQKEMLEEVEQSNLGGDQLMFTNKGEIVTAPQNDEGDSVSQSQEDLDEGETQKYDGHNQHGDAVFLSKSAGESQTEEKDGAGEPLTEEEEGAGEPLTEEEEGAGESQTEEEEGAGESKTEEEEGAGEPLTEEEEGAGESKTEEEEGAGEPLTEEEEGAGEPLTEKEEGAGESQTEEEEGAGESQTEEEEGAGESQTEEEEGGGESQTEEEEGAGESQTEEEEGAGESQTEEEEGAGESQTEEEEGAGESQTEEEEGAGESQTEEEEDAGESQIQDSAAESQSKDVEVGSQTEDEGEEEAELGEDAKEQEGGVESQTEEAAANSQSQDDVVGSLSEENEEEYNLKGEEEKEDVQTLEQLECDLERISRRAHRSEGVLTLPVTEAGEDLVDTTGAGWSDAKRRTHSAVDLNASPRLEGNALKPDGAEHSEQEQEGGFYAEDNPESGKETLHLLGVTRDVEFSEPLGDAPPEEPPVQDDVEQDEEWEDEEDEEFPSKTPAFVREKRTFFHPDHLASPSVVKNIHASDKTEVLPVVKPKKVRRTKETTKMEKTLPKTYLMSVFKHFAKAKVSADVYPVLNEIMNKFFDRLVEDLETYAAHAKRKTIEVEDAVLLLKRQGYVNDKVPVEVLIEKYLRMDQRRILIPIATSGNVVIPKRRR